MKKILRKVVLFALAICMTMGTCNAVFAEEETASFEEEVRYGQLGLDVEYTEPELGKPVTFTLKPSGGSGNYKYLFQCVQLYSEDYGSYYYVTDPGISKYSEQNVYEFTFTASGKYTVYFYVMDMANYSALRQIVEIELYDEAYPSIEEVADRVAEECLSKGFKDDFEKALWLHDWVLDNVEYDYTYNYCGPEGVLTRGKGICESYHRAYAMLLERVGIEAKRMTGNTHCWTAAKLDGKWYQIDPTWDDCGYPEYYDCEYHLYFGLNDEIMSLVHSDHKPVAGCESNSLEDNYFIRTGEIKKWSSEFTEEIQSKLNSNVKTFEIPIVHKYYANVLYNLVAYQLSNESWKANGKDVKLNVNFDCKDSLNGTLVFNAAYINSGNKDFVTRLYKECLDRKPDASGLNNWVSKLETGEIDGAHLAYGFLFSQEFINKNYCNACYINKLYKAIFGREADKAGFDSWMNALNSGVTREEVFNGFIGSKEFKALCNSYGIIRGNGVDVPAKGTVQTGTCVGCGAKDPITLFVERLYNICLDRKPDKAGLNDWCGKLYNNTITGKECAYSFFFSPEFTGKKYDDGTYVEYLYKVLLGRNSDKAGKTNWVNQLKKGESRLSIFYGFAGSVEFANICKKYGIRP